MSNVLLSWGFPTDSATATATSEAGNMLVGNLQNQQPSSVWRSTGVNNEEVTFDLGGASTVRMLYIDNHNLSTGAWIDVFFSADNFVTIAKQLSYNITNPYILGLGLEPLGVCSLGSTSICDPLPGTKLRNFFLFDPQASRYIKVRMNDPGNPDGHIQAGRIVLGNYWQPKYNPEYGYNQNLMISSDGKFSRGGSWFARRRPQKNTFSMNFPWLSDGEAATLNNMIRRVDKNKNILFAAFPDSNTNKGANNLGLCFLESHSGVSHTQYELRQMNLVLREAI